MHLLNTFNDLDFVAFQQRDLITRSMYKNKPVYKDNDFLPSCERVTLPFLTLHLDVETLRMGGYEKPYEYRYISDDEYASYVDEYISHENDNEYLNEDGITYERHNHERYGESFNKFCERAIEPI